MLVLKCIQERCPCFSRECSGNPKIDPDCQWMNWCNKQKEQPGYFTPDQCPMDEGPLYYNDDHVNQYFNPTPPTCCPNCKNCSFENYMKKVRKNKHRRENYKAKRQKLEELHTKEQNKINRLYR